MEGKVWLRPQAELYYEVNEKKKSRKEKPQRHRRPLFQRRRAKCFSPVLTAFTSALLGYEPDAAGAATSHAESAAECTGSRSLEATSGLRRAGALTVIRQCVAHQVSDRVRDGIGLGDGGGGGGGFDAGDIQSG